MPQLFHKASADAVAASGLKRHVLEECTETITTASHSSAPYDPMSPTTPTPYKAAMVAKAKETDGGAPAPAPSSRRPPLPEGTPLVRSAVASKSSSSESSGQRRRRQTLGASQTACAADVGEEDGAGTAEARPATSYFPDTAGSSPEEVAYCYYWYYYWAMHQGQQGSEEDADDGLAAFMSWMEAQRQPAAPPRTGGGGATSGAWPPHEERDLLQPSYPSSYVPQQLPPPPPPPPPCATGAGAGHTACRGVTDTTLPYADEEAETRTHETTPTHSSNSHTQSSISPSPAPAITHPHPHPRPLPLSLATPPSMYSGCLIPNTQALAQQRTIDRTATATHPTDSPPPRPTTAKDTSVAPPAAVPDKLQRVQRSSEPELPSRTADRPAPRGYRRSRTSDGHCYCAATYSVDLAAFTSAFATAFAASGAVAQEDQQGPLPLRRGSSGSTSAGGAAVVEVPANAGRKQTEAALAEFQPAEDAAEGEAEGHTSGSPLSRVQLWRLHYLLSWCESATSAMERASSTALSASSRGLHPSQSSSPCGGPIQNIEPPFYRELPTALSMAPLPGSPLPGSLHGAEDGPVSTACSCCELAEAVEEAAAAAAPCEAFLYAQHQQRSAPSPATAVGATAVAPRSLPPQMETPSSASCSASFTPCEMGGAEAGRASGGEPNPHPNKNSTYNSSSGFFWVAPDQVATAYDAARDARSLEEAAWTAAAAEFLKAQELAETPLLPGVLLSWRHNPYDENVLHSSSMRRNGRSREASVSSPASMTPSAGLWDVMRSEAGSISAGPDPLSPVDRAFLEAYAPLTLEEDRYGQNTPSALSGQTSLSPSPATPHHRYHRHHHGHAALGQQPSAQLPLPSAGDDSLQGHQRAPRGHLRALQLVPALYAGDDDDDEDRDNGNSLMESETTAAGHDPRLAERGSWPSSAAVPAALDRRWHRGTMGSLITSPAVNPLLQYRRTGATATATADASKPYPLVGGGLDGLAGASTDSSDAEETESEDAFRSLGALTDAQLQSRAVELKKALLAPFDRKDYLTVLRNPPRPAHTRRYRDGEEALYEKKPAQQPLLEEDEEELEEEEEDEDSLEAALMAALPPYNAAVGLGEQEQDNSRDGRSPSVMHLEMQGRCHPLCFDVLLPPTEAGEWDERQLDSTEAISLLQQTACPAPALLPRRAGRPATLVLPMALENGLLPKTMEVSVDLTLSPFEDVRELQRLTLRHGVRFLPGWGHRENCVRAVNSRCGRRGAGGVARSRAAEEETNRSGAAANRFPFMRRCEVVYYYVLEVYATPLAAGQGSALPELSSGVGPRRRGGFHWKVRRAARQLDLRHRLAEEENGAKRRRIVFASSSHYFQVGAVVVADGDLGVELYYVRLVVHQDVWRTSYVNPPYVAAKEGGGRSKLTAAKLERGMRQVLGLEETAKDPAAQPPHRMPKESDFLALAAYRYAWPSELVVCERVLPQLRCCTMLLLHRLQLHYTRMGDRATTTKKKGAVVMEHTREDLLHPTWGSPFHQCDVVAMRFQYVSFQADGQKLTIQYFSETPVRFLELATLLYHMFRCRVWIVSCPVPNDKAAAVRTFTSIIRRTMAPTSPKLLELHEKLIMERDKTAAAAAADDDDAAAEPMSPPSREKDNAETTIHDQTQGDRGPTRTYLARGAATEPPLPPRDREPNGEAPARTVENAGGQEVQTSAALVKLSPLPDTTPTTEVLLHATGLREMWRMPMSELMRHVALPSEEEEEEKEDDVNGTPAISEDEGGDRSIRPTAAGGRKAKSRRGAATGDRNRRCSSRLRQDEELSAMQPFKDYDALRAASQLKYDETCGQQDKERADTPLAGEGEVPYLLIVEKPQEHGATPAVFADPGNGKELVRVRVPATRTMLFCCAKRLFEPDSLVVVDGPWKKPEVARVICVIGREAWNAALEGIQIVPSLLEEARTKKLCSEDKREAPVHSSNVWVSPSYLLRQRLPDDASWGQRPALSLEYAAEPSIRLIRLNSITSATHPPSGKLRIPMREQLFLLTAAHRTAAPGEECLCRSVLPHLGAVVLLLLQRAQAEERSRIRKRQTRQFPGSDILAMNFVWCGWQADTSRIFVLMYNQLLYQQQQQQRRKREGWEEEEEDRASPRRRGRTPHQSYGELRVVDVARYIFRKLGCNAWIRELLLRMNSFFFPHRIDHKEKKADVRRGGLALSTITMMRMDINEAMIFYISDIYLSSYTYRSYYLYILYNRVYHTMRLYESSVWATASTTLLVRLHACRAQIVENATQLLPLANAKNHYDTDNNKTNNKKNKQRTHNR
eukprot:gene807-448_t